MPVVEFFPVDDDEVLKAAGVKYVAINEPKLIVGHNGKDHTPIQVTITRQWENGVSKDLEEQCKPHFSQDQIARLVLYIGNKIYSRNAEIIAKIDAAQKKRDDHDHDGDNDKDGDEDDASESRANIALKLAQAHSRKLFVNESGQGYAAMIVDDHVEIHPMEERRFRNWICGLYHKMEDDMLSEEDLKKVVRILEAKAEFGSDVSRHRLDVRVRGYNRQKELDFENRESAYNGYELGDEDEDAEDFDEIYYDLTNKKWEAIRITAQGWEIVKDPPILFRRHGGERAQPHPNRNYRKDVLKQFIGLLNVKNPDHVTILKGIIPSYLWTPTIPKFVLMNTAAHGTGKTTMFELIKDSIDPNVTKTASLPGEIHNLKQFLSHNYIAFFDNVSYLSDDQSDTLCRAVTGSGDMKRKLYENDADIIYSHRRVIGLNGINNAATRPDLLDRGIIIELEKIDRQNRKLLGRIKRDCNKLKPELLAFYLDVLVEVLKERQKYRDADPDYYGLKELIQQTGGLPRMADAAILCEQIAAKVAEKMGEPYTPGDFLRALDRNLMTLNVEALKESLIAEVLITFMTDMETYGKGVDPVKFGDPYPHWVGSPTMLLGELNDFIVNHPDLKIDTRSKSWAKDPSSFGKQLRQISTNLAAVGITISYKPTETNMLYNIAKMPTVPASLQEGVNSRSNEPQNPVGSDVGKPTGVPTGNEDQNRAQNGSGCRDVGNVGKSPFLGSELSSIAVSEKEIRDVIQRAMKDEQGNTKDYFMLHDFDTRLLMLPNRHLTVQRSQQIFCQLLEWGWMEELEPGRYGPTAKFHEMTESKKEEGEKGEHSK